MNKKITDLPLKTTSLAAGDLFEVSEDQGAGVFVSKKIAGNQFVGPQGPQGPAGTNGTNGTNGAQGEQGIQGIQGPIGPAGGVTQIIAGTNITISPVGGTGAVTINSSNSSGFQFTYEIGQYVASEGGVIMHRWLSTSPFGTPTSGSTQNYLVVDTQDLVGLILPGAVQYASLNLDIPNTQSTYDGFANTVNLISAGDPFGITTNTAAVLCNSSSNNSQNDWYLPAVDELVKLNNNRWEVAQGITASGTGTQLLFNFYWSSTEFNSSSAFSFGFQSGIYNVASKQNSLFVRAIRKFSI